MKIILTSDLDRTLIFSKKLLIENEKYHAIESLKGEELSFMSNKTLMNVQLLNSEKQLIPVTTRSVEQYRRITVFQESPPQYAVTSNGGVILENGEISEAWKVIIQNKMASLDSNFEQMKSNLVDYFSWNFVLRMHEVENLFFVLIVDPEQVTQSHIAEWEEFFRNSHWSFHLQGKKLYVIPNFLTKGHAVDYIKQIIKPDFHYAAGDSVLDLSMLTIANEYFVPAHGELAKVKDVEVMAESSSDFSEVFLEKILKHQ